MNIKKPDPVHGREKILNGETHCFQLYNYIFLNGIFGKHLVHKNWNIVKKVVEQNNERGILECKTNKRKIKLKRFSEHCFRSKEFKEHKKIKIMLNSNLRKSIYHSIKSTLKKQTQKNQNISQSKMIKKRITKFKKVVNDIQVRFKLRPTRYLNIEKKYFEELVDGLISGKRIKAKNISNLTTGT